MKIKTESLVKDLEEVCAVVGHPPTYREYLIHGKFARNTITRRFGSWNKALLEVFGKVNITTRGDNVNKKCANPLCGKEIIVNKSVEREYNFCSQSCSATFFNKTSKKRKLTNMCVDCSKLIGKRQKYCTDCYQQKTENYMKQMGEKTIQDVLYHIGANKYGTVRFHSRKVTSIREQKCERCGYDKHVQTCHIKSIASFSLDTKLKEVNDPNNLLLLCPNCHWELDHPKH